MYKLMSIKGKEITVRTWEEHLKHKLLMELLREQIHLSNEFVTHLKIEINKISK